MTYLDGVEENLLDSRDVFLEYACVLGICKKGETPSAFLKGKPVNCGFDVVKDYGGFKKVKEDSTWNKIALKCGFECDVDQEVKIT
ncbi:hypothetical protein Hanom_Chr11g01028221 [Helianthus anomalus]